MNAHDRGVDHLDIAVVGLRDGVHEPIPMAGLAPAVEAIVAGRVGAVALRQIAPRRARAQHPEDAVQNPPVVDPRHAPWLVRKKRLDDRPFKIRKVIASAHDQAPTVWKLESQCGRFVYPFYGYMA